MAKLIQYCKVKKKGKEKKRKKKRSTEKKKKKNNTKNLNIFNQKKNHTHNLNGCGIFLLYFHVYTSYFNDSINVSCLKCIITSFKKTISIFS